MSINMYICINAITVSVANNSPNIYTLKSPLEGSWQSPMQPEMVWLSMREARRRCGSVGVAAVVEWGRGTSGKTPWGRATCPPVAIHCAGGLEQPTKKSRTATINKRTLVIIIHPRSHIWHFRTLTWRMAPVIVSWWLELLLCFDLEV